MFISRLAISWKFSLQACCAAAAAVFPTHPPVSIYVSQTSWAAPHVPSVLGASIVVAAPRCGAMPWRLGFATPRQVIPGGCEGPLYLWRRDARGARSFRHRSNSRAARAALCQSQGG